MSIVFASCQNNKAIIKSDKKIRKTEKLTTYRKVTDSVLFALHKNNEKVQEERLFWDYYKFDSEIQNFELNDSIINLISSHFDKLVIKEFGKPKIKDFNVLIKDKKTTIKGNNFIYDVLNNEYSLNIPAYPSFGKIALLYNLKSKLLTVIYCEDISINNQLIIKQSIRDKIINNFYKYDIDKQNFILTHSKYIEE